MAINQAYMAAACKGCPLCGGAIESVCANCKSLFPVGKVHICFSQWLNSSVSVMIEPAGDPFLSGPYEGRYWCRPCWVLYWSENPHYLADDSSRRQVSEEARLCLLGRKGLEVLFQEGTNRICLTDRGTLLFEIKRTEGLIAEEYDPERFQMLMRALQAVEQKEIAGYQSSVKSA